MLLCPPGRSSFLKFARKHLVLSGICRARCARRRCYILTADKTLIKRKVICLSECCAFQGVHTSRDKYYRAVSLQMRWRVQSSALGNKMKILFHLHILPHPAAFPPLFHFCVRIFMKVFTSRLRIPAIKE